MTPEIRIGCDADRADLIDLWIEAWQAAMPQIDFESRRNWIAAHLQGLVSKGATLLVAHRAGAPAGFVTVDPEGLVDQLVVAISCQRQGVAQALLAAARARGAQRLRLTVNLDNETAVRFYERRGFRRVSSGINPLSGLPVLHMEG